MLTLPYPVSANRYCDGMLILPTGAGIYQIVDVETRRFYVGSAANLRRRWKFHKYRLCKGTHPNPMLQAIWNKNPDRLLVSVVALLSGADRVALLEAEQRVLDASGVGTNRECMNVLAIAGSHLGRKRSDATRRALSDSMRGKRASDEAREKMRLAKLGRKQAPELVARLALQRRGRKINRPFGIPQLKLRRLTNDQVLDLRAKREEGFSWSQLAAVSGLSKGTTKRAVTGQTYANVK